MFVLRIDYQELYHTKNYQGTTTAVLSVTLIFYIIPYQELPGNYNLSSSAAWGESIIPYQELPGNYNTRRPPQRPG